ncbi:10802_t:CDS:2 [Dentiscutata erythropus]|uniref:10802_t:CDS:1 n=1 Tax=Dentiscutata erythropus TaxID=1348616 RepID=A0A9N8YWH8_9GLOM|nr:10802_t:CDS:2 [Dentiscutata erythropus]
MQYNKAFAIKKGFIQPITKTIETTKTLKEECFNIVLTKGINLYANEQYVDKY